MVNSQGKRKKKRLTTQLQMEVHDCTEDYPFLRDDRVVEYIKRSKVMFIMRGLPGSGKSTIVNLIQKIYKRATVGSADYFFCHDGRYEYDANLLSSAHNNCQELMKIACANGRRVVIVDNTNIRKWEMKFYLRLAAENNYVVITVSPKTSWRFDAVKLAEKNKHGVSAEIIEKKITTFEDTIPLYYGWFLNEIDSGKLMEISREFFQECLKMVPDFTTLLQHHNGYTAESADDSAEKKTLDGYFTRYNAAGILHCTTMFCRWGKEHEASEYHRNETVQKSCGQTYQLNITGLVITPRTFSARIQLTDCQLFKLWGQRERENQHMKSNCAMHTNPTSDTNNAKITSDCLKSALLHRRGSSVDEGLAEDCSKLSLASAGDCSATDQTLEYEAMKNSMSTSGSTRCGLAPWIGQSAHITLGCAKGIQAKQSGLDILEITQLASRKETLAFPPIQTNNAVIYYYGEGRCEIIFNETLKMVSLFSGFY